jgi:hemoglobin/transferrin/lactoferrin receptor protein
MSGDIEEVTVESFFFKQKITSSTSPIGVVTAKDLDGIPLQGIADALKLEPSVSIKSDGIWATAPVIRGLSGQRVIVAVDGNRIETATEIAGGMNMINLNDVQQIEIIKSGASSMYGSGAIGGVINFITQPIVYSTTPAFNTALSSSYQSVNNLFDEYLRFTASKEKLFFSLSGSYRHAENTMTPAGVLDNSQFEDFSVNSKLAYRINDQHELRFQYQNFQARDVGIPGAEAFAKPFTVTYPEHSRSMADVQYLFKDISKNFKLLKIKAYQQYIYRGVEVKTNLPMYKSKPVSITPIGEHQLWGGLAQTDFEWKQQRLTAGVDLWQRNLESTREKLISLPDSSLMVRGELPLPKASYNSNGLFARTERRFLNDKLNTSLGARYDYIIVNNDAVYDPVYMIKNGTELNIPKRLTIEENTRTMSSWSANFGANYQASEALNIALSGGHSFRAPNVEELYKYINLGTRVNIGNPDLVPEESNFADLGVHYSAKSISFSVNGFINKLTNMVIEEPGLAYYDNYNSDGDVVSTDTIAASILNNVDEALLYGFDASVKWEFIPQLFLSGNIAYTIGENLTSDGYLPQMAPMNGRLGLRYNGYTYLKGEINYEWAAKQDKLATDETMTEAYGLVNLNLSSPQFTIGKTKLQAFAGMRNIFDTEYTNHLSSNRGSITVEPGRNFYVKLKLSL